MGLPHVTATQVVPSTVSEISKDISVIVAALKVKLYPLTDDPFEYQNLCQYSLSLRIQMIVP